MADVTPITKLGPGGVPMPAGGEIDVFVLGIPLRPNDPGWFIYTAMTDSANSTVLTQENF